MDHTRNLKAEIKRLNARIKSLEEASPQWGVGDQADAKAFATADVAGQRVDLIHGQFPHSRRDNNTYARMSHHIVAFDGNRPLERPFRRRDSRPRHPRREVRRGHHLYDGVQGRVDGHHRPAAPP